MAVSKTIKSFWLKGLTNIAAKKERTDLLRSELGLSMLSAYLVEAKQKTLEGYSIYTNYDSANWELQVAENNGRLKMIEELLTLLDFKQQ